MPTGVGHHGAGPFIVVARCAAGHLEQTVPAVIARIEAVALENVGVVLRGHVTAAAPGLVPDSEVLHAPWLLASVGCTQLGHGPAISGHVFDPLRELFDSPGADVAADIRLGPEQFAEIQKFVGAKGVVFDRPSPVAVDHLRAILARADAVTPMIFVGKAASGPTQHGHLQRLQRFQNIGTIAILIRDVRLRPDPYAVVDTSAEVL